MAFQLSPGVLVTEKDLTLIIPSVATTTGAFAGAFRWGPASEVTTVDSEVALVERFGTPNDTTFRSFFTAANFLSYGNNLQLVRVIDKSAALNAAGTSNVDSNASATPALIENEEDYVENHSSGAAGTDWFAKWPGTLGNSLKVSLCDSNSFSTWEFASNFDSAPNTSPYASSVGGTNDELHVIVIDEDGLFTGVRNTVLEKFPFVSKASDAKLSDGTNNYYKDRINSNSKYIWWGSHPVANISFSLNGVSNWGSQAAGVNFAPTSNTGDITVSLAGGFSGDAVSDANILAGFNLFANDELFDISLIPVGAANASLVTSIINNVAEVRKDCIVFCSPELTDVTGSTADKATDVVGFRNNLPSSSYAVMDSGWKYQYDRYNDVYRYIPLNGDTAGLCVRTDFVADPWFSPAGLNRGQIKNVVKLAFSPKKTERDILYKGGVNPVVTFPGQGTVLFGDKTLLAKPSAFDRINVRRLFIVLEKAIATASKFQLFEFNDAFTRAQFRNLVEPFLRDVQGRRGITDFKVVCDETNNTGEVIDRNEFVADIFIKPARSINFIQLNFVATRTGISFEEVGA
jgi:hypothetical protein